MDIRDLLPIGSIVLLQGAEKKLMVTGIKQHAEDEPDKEYDYCGVVYPEGNLGREMNFLFNTSDIGVVVHRGYEDEERREFINKLAAFYEAENNGQQE